MASWDINEAHYFNDEAITDSIFWNLERIFDECKCNQLVVVKETRSYVLHEGIKSSHEDSVS